MNWKENKNLKERIKTERKKKTGTTSRGRRMWEVNQTTRA